MDDEPPTKKSRNTEDEEETPNDEKEVNVRSITLDLSKYPDWVRSLSDKELEKIFEVGVLVRESLQMTVNSNPKHLEEVLGSLFESQMEPFQGRVDTIEEDVQVIETQILEEMKKLSQSVEALGKPKAKGSMGERLVLDILKAGLPRSFTVQYSATFGNSGDVLVTTSEGENFPIEVKTQEKPIKKEEIEKFEKVVVDYPQAKVGILLSLKSGIARRSKRGKFEIYLDKNKYFIYVPNALEEENLIVWSVMLANELAHTNAELKENHKTMLSTLYENFKKSVENAKTSRNNLRSLEEAVKKLKESLEPILDILVQSKNDIYKMLHN